jgi:hypothetical protein
LFDSIGWGGGGVMRERHEQALASTPDYFRA